MTASRGVLVLVIATATAGPAHAQFVGSEFRVNTFTTNGQTSAGVAAGANGDFVVVWGSNLQDGSYQGVYAQRYASNGSALGAEFRVNTYTSAAQQQPVVAAASNGDFVVAWMSNWQDTGSYGWGVFGQRYASDGTTRGAEFRVNTFTTNNQWFPAIGAAPNGDFVVTWTSSQDGSNYSIHAQRYASDGTARGSEFQANTYTTAWQAESSVAVAGNGNFIVTWGSQQEPSFNAGIYARRYASDGTSLGGEFHVNTYTTNTQWRPAIAAASNGDFVIAWESYAGQDGAGSGIYAQRFASDGTARGSEFRVNTQTADEQRRPTVAAEPDGDFVVAWRSNLQDGSAYGVYAQRYASDGTAVGAEFRVNTHTTGTQGTPAVAAVASGAFVVAWESNGQDGSGYGVYAQRVANGLTVTSPWSNAKWGVGSAQRLRWEHNLGTAATFQVELSRDGGTSFSPLSANAPSSTATAGNYLYTVAACSPSCPETGVVRVTSNGAATLVGTSPTFTLLNATPPTVRKPNATNVGASSVSGPFTIVWVHTTGYRSGFLIELSRDGGVTYPTVIAARALAQWATRGEFTYAFTGSCTPIDSCQVRVTDDLGLVATSAAFNIQ